MSDKPVTQAQAKPAPTSGEENRNLAVTPLIDILETEHELLLLADMPGVTPEGVDIRFEKGELTVHGRRQPTQVDMKRALWEYDAPSYFRTFRVTEQIAADKIEATMKNGVLTLRLPKIEAVKPRRITVKG